MFTEAEILFGLRQTEGGTNVKEVCRNLVISDVTIYNSKKKYGGLGTSELCRPRQFETENAELKKLVADLSPTRYAYTSYVSNADQPRARSNRSARSSQKF